MLLWYHPKSILCLFNTNLQSVSIVIPHEVSDPSPRVVPQTSRETNKRTEVATYHCNKDRYRKKRKQTEIIYYTSSTKLTRYVNPADKDLRGLYILVKQLVLFLSSAFCSAETLLSFLLLYVFILGFIHWRGFSGHLRWCVIFLTSSLVFVKRWEMSEKIKEIHTFTFIFSIVYIKSF